MAFTSSNNAIVQFLNHTLNEAKTVTQGQAYQWCSVWLYPVASFFPPLVGEKTWVTHSVMYDPSMRVSQEEGRG